ncbi:mitotic checkpoint protein BUB3.1 [Capsicum annuum]|uniref:mitotic checkpoint protein BUB3.1 n=1 Tax=Capsicum annuum TaxID=4072 RepID=UPI001FB09F78|nr:mitotic checkpoint protein BUB3.1 [Capsicum annuum]
MVRNKYEIFLWLRAANKLGQSEYNLDKYYRSGAGWGVWSSGEGGYEVRGGAGWGVWSSGEGGYEVRGEDEMVRLYDVSANAMKEEFMHGGPVLDCCFYDASSGFSASTDNTVRRMYRQVTTGSWDRTLKCWDPRGASGGQEHTLVGTYPQPERVYSLSLVGNRLVVATAWNHVNVYDLRNMSQPEQQRESSLKYRITYVQCYPDGTGLFLILYLLLHSRA